MFSIVYGHWIRFYFELPKRFLYVKFVKPSKRYMIYCLLKVVEGIIGVSVGYVIYYWSIIGHCVSQVPI